MQGSERWGSLELNFLSSLCLSWRPSRLCGESFMLHPAAHHLGVSLTHAVQFVLALTFLVGAWLIVPDGFTVQRARHPGRPKLH